MHSVTSYSQAVVTAVELGHAALALLAPAAFGKFLDFLGMPVRKEDVLLIGLFFAALGAHNAHDATGLGPKSHGGLLCQLGTFTGLGAAIWLWTTGTAPRFLLLPLILLLGAGTEYMWLHTADADPASAASSPPRSSKASKKVRTSGGGSSSAPPPPLEAGKAD